MADVDDTGINLQSRILRSFYQPGDVVNFELDGKVWLATADTGSIRTLNLPTCRFDESVFARQWNQREYMYTDFYTHRDEMCCFTTVMWLKTDFSAFPDWGSKTTLVFQLLSCLLSLKQLKVFALRQRD